MNRQIKTALIAGLAALLLATESHFLAARVVNADDGIGVRAQEMAETARMKPIAVPRRLLMKYRAGVSSDRRASLMTAAGARSDRELPGLRVHVVELAEGADSEAYARVLRAQPDVEFVEPDYLCYPVSMMEPDDPLYSSQWHLPAISCPMAWGMTLGSDRITIALCDTGVDSTHPDLSAKLVPGWNVVDNNSDTSPVSSHGTWTAGAAAATGNNTIGVASPALNCRIMPVRVSSIPSGGAMQSDLAAGVVWAADHGARVASVSYMGAANSTMTAAGRYIQNKGGVLVMAAGNTATYNSAPDTSDIIVVSATAAGDALAGFTTTGTYVDLSAPGTNILTTAPGSAYQAVNGTSFSTPLVAGAIGLMLSLNPNLTPTQIDTILKVTADDLGPAGWDPGYGWGRLNAGRAINLTDAMMTGAPDTTPPAVGFVKPQIGGPSNGLIGISGSELVQVNALDERSVSEVSLSADGVSLGASTSAPYTFYFDTSLYADGSQHTVTAMARDESGNTTSISTRVTVRAGFDATPPTVGFVQPQMNGQIAISSAVSVQLAAADNLGVAAVSLIADGELVGTVAALPYTFTWNTLLFVSGSVHTLSAVAGDQANNWVSTSITVTAVDPRDTTPPSVTFKQPQAGGSVARSPDVQITANASDNASVASVSLYADGALVGADTSAPYLFSWNTSSLAAGSSHTLRAVAADQAGNSSTVSISVTIADRTPPTVSFQQPQAGGTVGKSQAEQITVNSSDNASVASVKLFADGALVGAYTSGPYVFSWNTSSLVAGSRHTLRAVAADQAGNSSSVSITITVIVSDATPPRVWFVDPEDGDSVKGDVRVNVGATDDIAVTRVEFYIDNQLFTTWTRGPYTVKWKTNRAARGNHTLKCVAFDAAGHNASTIITVEVR